MNNCTWKDLLEVAFLKRGIVISKDFLRDNNGIYPVYSSQTVNDGIMGYIDTFMFDGEFLTWTTDGANAGTIFHRKGKFNITNVCGLIEIKDDTIIKYRFLYFWLSYVSKQYVLEGMGNPKLMSNRMGLIKIPLPHIKVQEEIVKILDSFTNLIDSLNEELSLRQKQFEYYREKLLTDNRINRTCKTISELSIDIFSGATPSTKNKKYWDNGDIPWMNSGDIHQKIINCISNFITEEGYQSCSTKMVPIHSIVIALAGQGKTRGTVGITNTELCTNQSLCAIVTNDNIIIPKYLFYFLDKEYNNLRRVSSGDGTRGGLNLQMIKNYIIEYPSISIQQSIVEKLDAFESLISSLKEEIALRQKQYEYYREKLLTFD